MIRIQVLYIIWNKPCVGYIYERLNLEEVIYINIRYFEISVNISLNLFAYQYTGFKQGYIHLSNWTLQIRTEIDEFAL